jgi:hypothetical protein
VKVAMMMRQMLSTVSSGSQALHHVGLAAGAEGRAGHLRLLDRDQRLDDLRALHQQAVHRRIDAVDLAAQVGERGRSGFCHDGQTSLIVPVS